MDLQQPPAGPQTEIVQQQAISALKDPGMMIMEDLLKGIESNGEIYRQRLQETAQLREDFTAFRNDNFEKLSLLTKQFESVNEQISIITTAMEQKNQDLEQRLQPSENKIETLGNEIKLIHDNQKVLSTGYSLLHELNKRVQVLEGEKVNYTESQQTLERQFKFVKCFTAGMFSFLAGFLIWIYMHKAELLR